MWTLFSCLLDCFRARLVLQAEILALRHQLLVLEHSCRGRKLRLRWADRILWVWLSRFWNDWRSVLFLVKPETVIVFHEAGLRRILKDYFEYYESCRTHLSLEKDAPISRLVEPPSLGSVTQIPKVGGLHHLYTRKAA